MCSGENKSRKRIADQRGSMHCHCPTWSSTNDDGDDDADDGDGDDGDDVGDDEPQL